ncbi:MAG TPA: hypothetical protein CFH81_08835 [Sulfurovum sp. UBA12169]|nr:MAG TPA: hypothetical protein CFH81_08835 [Sulfurovum sp. UBA12169]
MRDFLLLLTALMLFVPVFVAGTVIHLRKEFKLRHRFSMTGYAYNIALHIDRAGGAMLFNSENKTISAMAYEKNIRWLVVLVNWIFRDQYHCLHAWQDEFGRAKL